MIKKIILMASMLAFVAGCVSSQMKDISVEAGADSDTDFLAYRHYTWLGSAAIVFDPEGRWEPPNFDADAEIQFLINSALRKRGLYENANDPDLIVAYAAGIDMESMKIKTDSVDPVLRETLENVPAGALSVILIDAASGEAVWIGTATAEIQQNPDSELVRKRLEYAVNSMFKQLPR